MASQIQVDDPSLCKHGAEWDSMTLQTFCEKACHFKGKSIFSLVRSYDFKMLFIISFDFKSRCWY